MIFHLSVSSGIPIYRQLETQLKQGIAAGALEAGDELPSVRKLATELRINPNTVARAYENLERDGIVRAVPGGGTYVANGTPGLLKSEKLRRLRLLARQIAVEGRQLRVSAPDIMKLVRQEIDLLEEGNDRGSDLNARFDKSVFRHEGS